jgi:hypothetical protein
MAFRKSLFGQELIVAFHPWGKRLARGALLGALACASAAGCSGDNNARRGGAAGASAAGGSGGTSFTGGSDGTGGVIDEEDASSGGSAGESDDAGPDVPLWDGATSGNLGDACADDSACMGGLVCAKATGTSWINGGPAQGYCTAPCSNNTDCLPFGGDCISELAPLDFAGGPFVAAWCLQTCDLSSTDSASICHGRKDKDVGCATWVYQSTKALCYPVCVHDSDCPSNRKCDPITTLCVDAPNTGAPIGTYCGTPEDGGPAPSCSGWCGSDRFLNPAPPSLCTRDCILGTTGCDTLSGAPDGGLGAACIPLVSGSHDGTLGHCVQLCDADRDCLGYGNPGIYCNMTNAIGGHGQCDGHPQTPPDGG